MKTKILSAVITFAALSTIASSAIAGAHDGYNRAFYGTKSSDTMTEMAGKAAYGAPSGNPWSGQEAYQHAFTGSIASPRSQPETMGKATYGSSSGPDGNAIYHRALGGSD